MALIGKGGYIYSEDYPYEKESIYQLNYYCSAALLSIEMIMNVDNNQLKESFANGAQYYRFYLDHLFYYVGQINDRFIFKNNKNMTKEESEHKKYLIQLNRNNYFFDENKYCNLCNKNPRNVIEHLDERNIITIRKYKGVGGFNTISNDTDLEMKNAILNNRKYYPYILDKEKNIVLFHDYQEKNRIVNEEEYEIDLHELKKELISLQNSIKEFDSICSRG